MSALQQQESPLPRHALVLSGGGAEGAYEVGVLKALANGLSACTDYKPLDLDICTGTSVGAFNAAFLVSECDKTVPTSVANLEQVWMTRLARNLHGNGVYRVRWDPFQLVNPARYFPNPLKPLGQFVSDSAFLGADAAKRIANLFHSDEIGFHEVIDLFNVGSFISAVPLRSLTHQILNYRNIRDSQKVLKIAATNWDTGELTIFDNADMTDETGPLAIRASASIPGFLPPTRKDGEQFVDGGILMNTPLKPAIRAGADVLQVVNMNAAVKDVPISSPPSTVETFYRQQLIDWAEHIQHDIERLDTYNKGLEFLDRCEHGSDVQDPGFATILAAKRLGERKYLKRYRPLTVHHIYPAEPLGDVTSLLDFSPKFLRMVMARGFDDAVNHDCGKAGCVIAPTLSSSDRSHRNAKPK